MKKARIVRLDSPYGELVQSGPGWRLQVQNGARGTVIPHRNTRNGFEPVEFAEISGLHVVRVEVPTHWLRAVP